MPLAHISLPVSSLPASREFYLAALKPLEYGVFNDFENAIGFNPKYDGPDFWIHKCPGSDEKAALKTHLAFKAKSQGQVRAFYEAALKAGARDNGKPGERANYTKGYYAAYILDPDGHNVECLYYQPLWLSAIEAAPSVLGAVFVGGVAWWAGRNGAGS